MNNMFWIISFFTLVASSQGCGVPQLHPHALFARSIDKEYKIKPIDENIPEIEVVDEEYKIKPIDENIPEIEVVDEEYKIKPIDENFHVIKVVDGWNANSWPWQVSFQTSRGGHFCGGTLINNYWVLTAAHCLIKPGNHFVVLGQTDRGSNKERIQTKNIAKVFTHPDYNKQTKFNNDVTLVKLSSPVQMTPRVSPICLPGSSSTILPGTICVTTGWGKTRTEMTSRLLQEAELPIVSQAQCRKEFGPNKITDAMICAGGSGVSSCQGDSGGPLMCKSSGVWYQVGIVSWGKIDCDVGVPLVYTRVSYFLKWIDEIVQFN